MKKTIFVIFSLLFSMQALADQPIAKKPILRSFLYDFEMGHTGLSGINRGELFINQEANTLTLHLEQKLNCKPGMACIAIAPASRTITLPIVSMSTPFCGGFVYEDEIDKTLVDGLREKFVVYDNTSMVCKIAVRDLTNVEYESYSPMTDTLETSSFNGEMIKPLPIY